MTRARLRAIGHWSLVIYAAWLLISGLFLWVTRDGRTYGIPQALALGVPAWHLLIPAYGALSLALLLRRVPGAYWYLGVGNTVFAFAVGIPLIVGWDRLRDAAGLEPTLFAALVFLLALAFALVALLMMFGETVPVTSFAAHIAYMGRLGHLRELFRFAQARGWDVAGPQEPAHSVYVKGRSDGRDVNIRSGELVSMLATGSQPYFYWVRVAAKSVLPPMSVAVGRAHTKPNDTSTELRAKHATVGRLKLEYYLWPQEGQRVSPDTMLRITNALDRGCRFLRAHSTVYTEYDAIWYGQTSGLRITDNADFMAQLVEWLTDVVSVLERETEIVEAEDAFAPPAPEPEASAAPALAPRPPVERTSLAGRALLALALTVGFYGLALAIAAALLFVAYADLFIAHRVDLRLVLVSAVAAFVILWSILPRRVRFEPPGPRLDLTDHPELSRLVEDLARQTGETMPREVYLTADVNAGVTERGGMLSIGSRRILIVGLPLLHGLTVDQVRGVLAHEFGHYYGGDTRLGPWIYKTSSAIGRTVESLQGPLQAPFRWYGLLFLRTTHAIRRRQEFVADRLAATLVGPEPYANGLRTIYGLSAAFEGYMNEEFVPVVEDGYVPPLLEGFTRFARAPRISAAIEAFVAEELHAARTDPYDSHPSLGERLAALATLPPVDSAPDTRPATALLADRAAAEKALLNHLVKPEFRNELRQVSWDDLGKVVYLPQWEDTVKEYRAALSPYTAAQLPNLVCGPSPLPEAIRQSAGRTLLQQEVDQAMRTIAGRALAAALARNGWQVDATPGTQITLRNGPQSIEPLVQAHALGEGKLTRETWAKRCEELGIAALPLVTE